MRSALLAALLAGGIVALINYGHNVSNADFIYMCAGAELLKKGTLLATPYFPPGYIALLWAMMQTGLSALDSGAVLSAFGTALTAGAVAYVARLWRNPPAVALGLGLLAASLPDVFQIACNPHLDALYTGLGAVLLATAMRALNPKPHAGVAVLAAFVSVLLIILRYHAVIAVLPVAVVLLCVRQARAAALAVLVCGLLASGYVYWSLYVATGSLETAAAKQIATGEVYRLQGPAAPGALFNDYPAWLEHYHEPGLGTVTEGIETNWPQFLLRKAILAGFALWLLGLIRQRVAPGSPWLIPYIAGYTLALAPTYFTPRASALPEVAGVMLAAAGLSMLFFLEAPVRKGSRRGGAPTHWLDPAVAGAVLFVLLCGALGYNAWREQRDQLGEWGVARRKLTVLSQQALQLAGGERRLAYGGVDRLMWPATAPGNLPGSTYSRLWMDDPDVAPAFAKLIPRYTPEQVLTGRTPVKVVALFPGHELPSGQALLGQLERSPLWREVKSDEPSARIWVRGP